MSDLASLDEDEIHEDSFLDEHIFLISTADPWYGDIIVYLHTLKVPPHLSRDEFQCLYHNSKNYLIIGGTFYSNGVDSILRHCLTYDEVEVAMNDFHGWACGGHLSGISTAQKTLRAGYYWFLIFKYYVNAVKRCHPC